VTGSGKIMRRPTMRSHNLEHKSSKQKRKFGRELGLAPSDKKTLKQLLRIK
jgi:ribosomal protein L35